MRLIAFITLIMTLPRFFLAAEDPPQNTAEGAAPFPLGRVLAASQENTPVWSPDWAPSIPPDAFRLTTGTAASITLVMDDGAEYRVAWNKAGGFAAFPALTHGALAQVTLAAPDKGEMTGFRIAGPRGLWVVEFIGAPVPGSLARVTQGGAVSFVALRHDGGAETWYDSEGTALAHFEADSWGNSTRLTGRSDRGEAITRHDYGSFGEVSAIESSDGAFSALYAGPGRPRYWTRREADGPAENLVLQWDEAGLLRGITSRDKSVDIRYAYTLDDKGNWTERQEQAMIKRFGVLVPQAPATVRRIIAYRGDER